MIKIGLTGSIGMGKTTTAGLFKSLGYPVFDADAAVHQLYSVGGKAVPLIRAVFPDAISNGAVDRQRLAAHMKKDSLNLPVLESFIHPMVADLRNDFILKAKKDHHKVAIFDVPLLFETGGESYVDKIIVVSAPAYVQRKRVLSRPGMSKALFEHLLSRQMPDDEKRKRADYIIFTHKGVDNAHKQVQSILDKILADQDKK